MPSILERLKSDEVVFLDGAVGTEIQRRGAPMSDVDWAATANETHPDIVRQVHEDYILAGADIVTANTFTTRRDMLEPAGKGDRVREVNMKALGLVREACENVGADRPIWVAGAISTKGTVGADDKNLPLLNAMRANYQEQADALAAGGADLILLEMMCDVDYTRLALEAAVATGLPVCAGFSCALAPDGRPVMYSGNTADEMTRTIALESVLEAVLPGGAAMAAVMHTKVGAMAPSLDTLFAHWSGPVAAYPDSGGWVWPNWIFEDVITPEALLGHARGWLDRGVKVLGGCCGLGPEHISLMREELVRTVPA